MKSSDKQEEDGGEVLVMDPGTRSEIHHSLLKAMACSFPQCMAESTGAYFDIWNFSLFILQFQTLRDTLCGQTVRLAECPKGAPANRLHMQSNLEKILQMRWIRVLNKWNVFSGALTTAL